jgi:hypothetical protein
VKRYLLLVLALTFTLDAVAAKRDFKGLFGSYRREKFTENEANSTDIGVDLRLSTLLPVTPLVKSTETVGGTPGAMSYSTFFNIEGEIHASINYYWQFFLGAGYFSYDTRKQNTVLENPQLPLFHQFDMTAYPVMLGVRYRLSTSDIVPYVGLGAGVSFVTRHGSYDYDATLYNTQYDQVLTGEAILGLEFYISSRMGIRLETSAFYMKLPEFVYATGGSPGNHPILDYQPNVWSIRYASGIFLLF